MSGHRYDAWPSYRNEGMSGCCTLGRSGGCCEYRARDRIRGWNSPYHPGDGHSWMDNPELRIQRPEIRMTGRRENA